MSVNRISLDITDAQKAEVASDTSKLINSTKDFNIVVTKEEIKHLPKMADGRLPFTEKAAEYSVSNPEFLPPHADVPEFQKDLKTFKDTREIARPVRQIADNLENTMTVSGSEAYDAARDYYKTVKFHAEMGTPGAQTIYEDLKRLYEIKSSAVEVNK
ncbi:hypothetical protein BH10ACI1_BH10ACI1_23500 [soil metagenome]